MTTRAKFDGSTLAFSLLLTAERLRAQANTLDAIAREITTTVEYATAARAVQELK